MLKDTSIEDIFQKLLDLMPPTEEELQMRANAHPLVLRAMTEKDDFIRELMEKTILEKSEEARNTIVGMILGSHSYDSRKLLLFISDAIINEFGGEEEAVAFACIHMNESKERLLKAIFNQPFIVQTPLGIKTISLSDIKEYIEGLETFQTASLIADFTDVIPNIVKEANEKLAALTQGAKLDMFLNQSNFSKFLNNNPASPPKVTKRITYQKNNELISLLKKYNLKQADMAKILNKSQPVISLWVNGHAKLPYTLDELEVILSRSLNLI